MTAVAARPPESAPLQVDVSEPAAPERLEAPSTVAFVADGTLIVASARTLLARAPDGTTQRIALEPNAAVGTSLEFPGVVVQAPEGDATLLETPGLTAIYKGKMESWMLSVNVIKSARSVHFERAGKLKTLTLPPSVRAGAQIDELVAIGTNRLNLTFLPEGQDAKVALLYDADTTSVIGDGVPIESMSGQAPKGAFIGTIGFRLEGNRVLRVDLQTGRVEKQATVACKPDQEFGNPTPSPSGDLLLVTCENDGIVLDGKKLTKLRTIPRIIPGCDNGSVLGGTVLRDGHTLLLEGCGGEARVDLRRGKYSCGDSPGIMGAPYEMLGNSGPRMPTGRAGTPACNGSGDTSQTYVGRTKRFKRTYDPPALIVDGATKIELEADADYQGSLAPDESAYAYARGDRVTIRSLPDGKVKAELAISSSP